MFQNKQKKQAAELVKKSLLLKTPEKTVWLANIQRMPPELLKRLIATLSKSNGFIDECLDAALADDHDHQYLYKLKKLYRTIKTRAVALYEKKNSQKAETELATKINKL